MPQEWSGLATLQRQGKARIPDKGVQGAGGTATGLTNIVLRNAMQETKALIAQAEQISLSGRDSLRVLEVLEKPPAPNATLLAAAHALPMKP